MAKELPYFKFSVADWLTGDIVYEDFNIQGLFINICAIYWQRNGILSIEDINKRYKNPIELSELSGRFFSLSDGFISIKFLDEQIEDRKRLSNTNSGNGKKGGRPKALVTLEEKANANRTLTEHKAKESNIEKKRKEKKRINSKIFFNESEIFDKHKFKEVFNTWSNDKLLYYYDIVLTWSNEGNKKIDWVATVRNWASRDEKEGRLKFSDSDSKGTGKYAKGQITTIN